MNNRSLQNLIHFLFFFTILYDIAPLFLFLSWDSFSMEAHQVITILYTIAMLPVLFFWGYCIAKSYKRADKYILKLLFFTCLYAPIYYWNHIHTVEVKE